MNNSTAKLIRKLIKPENTIAKKVYRRFKKEYNKLTADQRFKFKQDIRKTLEQK